MAEQNSTTRERQRQAEREWDALTGGLGAVRQERVGAMLADILKPLMSLADSLGIDLEDTSGGPWWHEEVAATALEVIDATRTLAEEFAIRLSRDEEQPV